MKCVAFPSAVMALLSCTASAFTVDTSKGGDVSLQMADSRRSFFEQVGTAAIAGAGLGFGVLAPAPANAAKLSDVNAKLKA
jgi:hypothetical protein